MAEKSMIFTSGFVSLLVLAAIHLFANQAKVLGSLWHGRFLSFAAGLSFAYVFVDLLPTLGKGELVLKNTLGDAIPYLDRHTYVVALCGLLFYYGLHTQSQKGTAINFWLAVGGYILFNFFVGASLADSENSDIQPIALYTIALGMHYFVHDHNTKTEDQTLFLQKIRWLLAAALFIGYFTGYFTGIPNTVEVIVVSFLAGGDTSQYVALRTSSKRTGSLCFLCARRIFLYIHFNWPWKSIRSIL